MMPAILKLVAILYFMCVSYLQVESFTIPTFQMKVAEKMQVMNEAKHKKKAKQVFNADSSRENISTALLDLGAKEYYLDGNFMNSLQSWLMTQPKEVSCKSLYSFYEELMKTYNTLATGDVLILPTAVGFTLVSTELGVEGIYESKGRPYGKPCGIMGTTSIYRTIFGTNPPTGLPSNICAAFFSDHKMQDNNKKFKIPDECIGNKSTVGVWVNLGPINEYLATRWWNERGEFLIGSSCNKSGEGNPKGKKFDVSYLDPDIRSNCHQVNIPHFGTPQLSKADGSWLSATILDLNKGTVIREGRDFAKVKSLTSDFKQ